MYLTPDIGHKCPDTLAGVVLGVSSCLLTFKHEPS